MKAYKRAAKKKLRFDTPRGMLATEDLFDLGFDDLNTAAKTVNKRIKENEEESFIEPEVASSTDDKLRLTILKDVIKTKLDAKAAAEKAMLTKQKKARILELMAEKEDEDLKGKSMEELSAMLDDL